MDKVLCPWTALLLLPTFVHAIDPIQSSATCSSPPYARGQNSGANIPLPPTELQCPNPTALGHRLYYTVPNQRLNNTRWTLPEWQMP